jgi:hypothetical protein
VLKANETISASQQEFIYDLFFRGKPEENLEVVDSLIGTLMCSPNPPPESLGPAILIPGGQVIFIS